MKRMIEDLIEQNQRFIEMEYIKSNPVSVAYLKGKIDAYNNILMTVVDKQWKHGKITLNRLTLS